MYKQLAQQQSYLVPFLLVVVPVEGVAEATYQVLWLEEEVMAVMEELVTSTLLASEVKVVVVVALQKKQNINVSEWVIVVKHQFINFSAISWLEQVNFQWNDDEVCFVLDHHTELDFIVLAHWNNSPWVDMSLHSDTLFWFRANQSLLFLLNAVCLVEKQQIPILKSFIWPDQGSNPGSITLMVSMVTITPPMRLKMIENTIIGRK